MNVTAGLKPLGWFCKRELYSIQNNIHGAVYAFAFLYNKPGIYQHPNEIEDTFYIGVSGGKESSILFDRKDKNTNRGEYSTLFKKRMKTHFSNLETKKEKFREKKYELFHEKYCPEFDTEKQIFVYVTVPGSDVRPFLKRALLSLAESEYIYAYGERFGKLPLMNLDEQHLETRLENSFSNIKMKNFQFDTLSKFL